MQPPISWQAQKWSVRTLWLGREVKEVDAAAPVATAVAAPLLPYICSVVRRVCKGQITFPLSEPRVMDTTPFTDISIRQHQSAATSCGNADE